MLCLLCLSLLVTGVSCAGRKVVAVGRLASFDEGTGKVVNWITDVMRARGWKRAAYFEAMPWSLSAYPVTRGMKWRIDDGIRAGLRSRKKEFSLVSDGMSAEALNTMGVTELFSLTDDRKLNAWSNQLKRYGELASTSAIIFGRYEYYKPIIRLTIYYIDIDNNLWSSTEFEFVEQ